MFWRLPTLSTSSPVESILDKENFTLEELLDEEEIIQECKALNSRLINFLRDGAQVEQLLRYIVEEPPEDAESKRVFKFPFVACEIFTCEIDVIFKTLVEDEELMNLLFSFLEPNRSHSSLLAGYFSKVVVCLMLRKTVPLMNYVQAHQDIFCRMVDLIGIISIMEVLVRLVGSDDHIYPNLVDVMQWLADSNLLEMIVDKLNSSCSPEVHANAAETLCAITRNASSPLTTKLSSPSILERIFGYALENSVSKSTLIHSLSVFISLLDPKCSSSGSMVHSLRSQHLYEAPSPVNADTVTAMLQKLGDLLMLLNVSTDNNVLPTTYGELQPPLGKHRLKIVEFFALLLRTGNEVAERELISCGAIQRILDLFFEYPFNNLLHHHVESIITSCLDSKNTPILDHLFRECNLIGKILQADRHSVLPGNSSLPTVSTAGRLSPRTGNLGHITRIANKLVQMGNGNDHIRAYLQENVHWVEWQTTVLHGRNIMENVYRWACGRPTALQERTRDSDEEEIHDRDYDVTALANNLSQAFSYSIYENEDAEEVHGSLERDDEDVYFDDESAEVVISSLRLGDDQESLFTNSNWFAFQEDRTADKSLSTSLSERMDEISLNGTSTAANGGSSSSDDEVVVGVDEELVGSSTASGVSDSSSKSLNGSIENFSTNGRGLNSDDSLRSEKASVSDDLGFLRCEAADDEDLFGERPVPDWVGWNESSDIQSGGCDGNPFKDNLDVSPSTEAQGREVSSLPNGDVKLPNGLASMSNSSNGALMTNASLQPTGTSLFEEDVEFVGVELEGTEKAMEHALKEGIVGEAGPLKNSLLTKTPEKDRSAGDDMGILEFNDTNYWRVDQEVGIVQE